MDLPKLLQILAIMHVYVATGVTSSCPTGWHVVGDMCYNIVSFATQRDTVDWDTAEAMCVSAGGHLASIHSIQQQTYLYNTIVEGYAYWIGLKHQVAEDTDYYTWIDGSNTDVVFWNVNKSPTEPDGGVGQDCVFMLKDERVNGENTSPQSSWGDDGCNIKLNYICGQRTKSVLVPDINTQCAGEDQGAVVVVWPEITAIDKRNATVSSAVTCTDSSDQTDVSLTGGVFGLGSHTVTCRVAYNDGSVNSASFTFNVAATPQFVLPSVDDQFITEDQTNTTLTWPLITAFNSDDRAITCGTNSSVGGASVSLTGGVFQEGRHVVTCTVTNDRGCTATESFTLNVTVCSLNCVNGGTKVLLICQCNCAQSWNGATCSRCALSSTSCLNGGSFSEEYCECVCPNGKSGIICNESVLVPDINTQCAGEDQGAVVVVWPEITAIDKRNATVSSAVTCTDSSDQTDVSLTGGVFGLGSHTVTCRVPYNDGSVNSADFTFNVAATPQFVLPSVDDQFITEDQTNTTVTWPLIPAFNSDDQAITCGTNSSVGGASVSLTGGVFQEGRHVVTCTVTNDGGCTATETFTLNVTVCSLNCVNGGTKVLLICQCSCAQSWNGATCSRCALSSTSCLNGGSFSEEYCECVCLNGKSGIICNVQDPCTINSDLCMDDAGQYCVASDPYDESTDGYTCACRQLDGYFYDTNTNACTREGFKSVIVIVIVEGINGIAIEFRFEFNDPNSAASREFLVQVAGVIQVELSRNSATRDVLSVHGVLLEEESGSVVFTGVVRAADTSNITVEIIQEVLTAEAADGVLTDGKTSLGVNPTITAKNTDDCDPNPCENGVCFDGPNAYACVCTNGYIGKHCQDTDEGIDTTIILVAVISVLGTLLVVMAIVATRLMRKRRNSKPVDSDPDLALGHLSQSSQAAVEVHANTMMSYDDTIAEEGLAPAAYEDVGLPYWAARWEIPRRHLSVDRQVLGKGNFGEVRSGTVEIAGEVTTVAIKIMKGNASSQEHEDFMEELHTMSNIGYHPNILSLIGACQYEDILYVALEYLPDGDLRSYLRRALSESGPSQEVLTSDQLVRFALDITKGMKHLAMSGVIHRDLAARNILLGKGLIAKVSDFGLSRGEDVYVQTSMRRVPTRWLALESLMYQTYTAKSDVWSFGIVLWEIATLGGTPYPAIADSKSLAGRLQEGYRMTKPINCHDEIYDMMLRCWEDDPNSRPTFTNLIALLSKMDEKKIEHTYMAVDRHHYANFSVIRPKLDDN